MANCCIMRSSLIAFILCLPFAACVLLASWKVLPAPRGFVARRLSPTLRSLRSLVLHPTLRSLRSLVRGYWDVVPSGQMTKSDWCALATSASKRLNLSNPRLNAVQSGERKARPTTIAPREHLAPKHGVGTVRKGGARIKLKTLEQTDNVSLCNRN